MPISLPYRLLEPRRFRLLLLQGGASQDLLSGSIQEYSLDQPPVYDALSYVWQQPLSWEETHNLPHQIKKPPDLMVFLNRHEGSNYAITIDGVLCSLLENLAIALWSFRRETSPRLMWVDQICIDQQNFDDKNHQIGLMGDIYKSAQQVLVWLGEEIDGVEDVLETIKSISLPSLIQMDGYSTPQPSRDELLLFEEKATLLNTDFYSRLSTICQRPWFHRVWVFQEVSMNANSTMFFGRHSVLFSLFSGFLFNIFQHLYRSRDNSIDKVDVFDAASFGRYASLADRSGKDDFLSLLTITEACFASDPRDKVYALGSLLKGEYASSGYRADYGRSTAETFIHATSIHLRVAKDLDILERAHPRREQQIPQLPTWVPNFTVNPREDTKKFLPYKYNQSWPFAASLKTEATVRFPFPECLSLNGRIVDEIGHVLETIPRYGDPAFRDQDHARAIYSSWQAHLGTMKETFPSYPWVGGTLEHAYWHTVTTDIHNQKLASSFHECPEITQSKATTNTELKEKMRINIRSVTEGRRLATTQAGALALCIPATRPKDLVCILAGGRMPFVLRKIDLGLSPSRAGEVKAFTLIGECFIHGIMYGAALESIGKEWEFEEFLIL